MSVDKRVVQRFGATLSVPSPDDHAATRVQMACAGRQRRRSRNAVSWQSVTRAIPTLRDRFDGVALRVPVLNGSLSSIVAVTRRPTTGGGGQPGAESGRARQALERRVGHDDGPAGQPATLQGIRTAQLWTRHSRRSSMAICVRWTAGTTTNSDSPTRSLRLLLKQPDRCTRPHEAPS